MKVKNTAIRMLVFAFLLTISMCMLSACNAEKAKESDAGEYHLYSMESGDDSYTNEDIVSYGLDCMVLTLYEDGTASLGFADDTETFNWKKGVLYSEEEELSYTIEDGKLSITQDGDTLVFMRVGDAPKKALVEHATNSSAVSETTDN